MADLREADRAPDAYAIVHRVCVTPNARVRGRFSDKSRQIDVLMDLRHDTDNSRRVIVDAKRRRRKLDVKDVEAFEGLMKDVGAHHGYLVSLVGHSKAAERRAQDAITISIVPLEHVEQIDPTKWPHCLGRKCPHGRVFWSGYPELSTSLLPVSRPDPGSKRLAYLHYVGKCDRCGRFHMNCRTCGDLLSFDDDDGEHQCSCKMPWFWFASIEQDEHGESSAELHVVMVNHEMTVDRRPLAIRRS
jgi:hypothetical protein